MAARGSRLGTTVAAVLLVAGALVARPGTASALASTVRQPLAVDFAGIHTEQVEVVSRDYGSVVSRDGDDLNAATEALTNARSTLSGAVATAASAASAEAAAAQRLATTAKQHLAAVASHRRAVTTAGIDRHRLAEVAIALYVGPPPTVVGVTDLTGTQIAGDASEYLDENRQEITRQVDVDARRQVATGRTEQHLAAAVTQETAERSDASELRQEAADAVVAASAVVASAQATTAKAATTLSDAQKAETAALAAVGPPAADSSPTIIGTPVLEPAQIVAWYNAGFDQDLTKASVAQLAGWYLSEGTTEHVRGDIAFAQAMVETGGFESADAVELNNYAGVGHCDSCAQGLAFPSPQGGVEGQIQLLRIFASPAGTSLTQPAVIPAVAPGGQFRGACCPSWQSLTGVWATDPDYGTKVLTIYKSMLDFALSQPPATPTPATAATTTTSTSTTVPGRSGG